MIIGAGAVLAASVGGAFALGGSGSRDGDVSDEQMQTLFSGEDEPECDERFERLSLGDRIAHLACVLALTAINGDDYDSKLTQMGINGSAPFHYTYYDGSLHDGFDGYIASGKTADPYGRDRGQINQWWGPSKDSPAPQEYIDWVNGGNFRGPWPKSDWGAMLPPEKWPGSVDYARFTCAEPTDMTDAGKAALAAGKACTGKLCFANCSAMPPHLHWAVGLNVTGGAQPSPIKVLSGMRTPEYGGEGITYEEPFETEEYQFIPCDATKSWAEQCRPGDYLGNGHVPHYMLYIGNDIVRRYFPNSDGFMGEAGASSHRLWGITTASSYSPNSDWMICRPKAKGDLEDRQDVSYLEERFETSLGCVEDDDRKRLQNDIAWCATWCASGEEIVFEPTAYPWNKIEDENLDGEFALLDKVKELEPSFNRAYASCNQFACGVVAAVADMGAAPSDASGGSNSPHNMLHYCLTHPEIYEEIEVSSVDELEPGDIFTHCKDDNCEWGENSDGWEHTSIYVGNDMIRTRFPDSSGNLCEAGYNDGKDGSEAYAKYPAVKEISDAYLGPMGNRVFRVRRRNDSSGYPEVDYKSILSEAVGAEYVYISF